ncbi:hypothetical protein [Pseudonocardia adelaidensis]|uniref:Uncharacterized protein n=1 Tax=Pseudonocardia adelaidensis TaxID=648754 RepID=A0ABP9NLM3_9PSEU
MTVPATVDGAPATAAGAWSFATAGALLVLYPALRPWSDATPQGAPAAFTSPAWVPAHLAAVAAFVLVAFSLFGLRAALVRTGGARPMTGAALMWAVGAALVLPYYGAEAFALPVIGERIVHTGDSGLLEVVEAFRMGTWPATTFAAGLLLLAAAGVLVAVAVAGSGVFPRWAGLPFAVGFALYLPQFFGPPALRIAHGVLVGVGCLVLAAGMRGNRELIRVARR